MRRFFDANDPHGFSAFSSTHWAALAAALLAVVLLYVARGWLRTGKRSVRARWTLAGILALCEIFLNVWYVAEGVYSAKDTLPLELCSISLYLCVAMLLSRSRRIFQIVYFTGIGGALMALLTPVLGYDFPHFRFMEFFTAHISIVLSVLFMIWVEGFRPAFMSIVWTMGFLNVLLVAVGFVNYMSGGNYMFLSRKPDTASLLDVLGPHPWYLLSLEGAALVMFVLLYLPFAWGGDRRSRRRGHAGGSGKKFGS